MTKSKAFPHILGVGIALLVLAIICYLTCPAINVHNPGLWLLVALGTLIYLVVSHLCRGFRAPIVVTKKGSQHHIELDKSAIRHIGADFRLYLIPVGILALMGLCALIGSEMFNAKAYANILTVTEGDFTTDLSESVGTDSIALMDTSSAQMLGDREIGSLSHVVSQYDVANAYTQIDYQGKPIKVAPLEYAGFFKWISNSATGATGYVTVDPVSMSASFKECEGMKYIPSAYFGQDAARHLWSQFPTLMLENLHFEIDEEGKPYYVASIIKKSIFLFGGKTVSGCVVMDPVSGACTRYDLKDIPRWVDVVFDGYLICDQYNWQGLYQNGWFNSLFAKKGCKQVTTYTQLDEEGYEVESTDFGYVAKDGDIWIYTGITSVNGDSSNIGFLLANERTGESHFYAIAGADEKSAMHAAEGEVQEKRYAASFPSLINVAGEPTYIMVLKDSGGLVKLYAAVNVEQYNLVATGGSLTECLTNYKELIGTEATPLPDAAETTVSLTIASIQHVVIDGNTYLYLADESGNLYRAKAADHEEMLLLKEGDTVTLTVSGKEIKACQRTE
ncbi:MAG: hypothetical protein IJN04_00765 [Clostridia bacterium]|nr:hypothetical protein [Clostridia bacterium]